MRGDMQQRMNEVMETDRLGVGREKGTHPLSEAELTIDCSRSQSIAPLSSRGVGSLERRFISNSTRPKHYSLVH